MKDLFNDLDLCEQVPKLPKFQPVPKESTAKILVTQFYKKVKHNFTICKFIICEFTIC